nr:beta-1,3-galactosyltransferase 1-like [Nerophis lumbriciformis]
MSDGKKLRKWSNGTYRSRCLFFPLALLAVVLFFYNITVENSDGRARLWKQYDAKKWWHGQESSSQGKEIDRTTTASAIVWETQSSPYFVAYPSEYRFIINEPQKCEEEKPFVVLMVPVAPSSRRRRDVIRRTWGGQREVLGKRVTVFFLLGLHTGEPVEQLEEKLQQESKEHQDLIQSNFMDCYNNLTIKSMVMLEWLDSYCSGIPYAMKVDSDIYLNLQNLITMLLNAPETNYMTGHVAKGAEVFRDPNSKWYLPANIYPKPFYPSYVLGLGYVLSLDLPKKLLEASRHVKAIYIEDVYLGLCIEYLGITPMDPPDWNYFHFVPVPYDRCAYSELVATTLDEDTNLEWVWKDLQREGKVC